MKLYVVFDMETGSDPMPLGLYVRREEDAVIYDNGSGPYRAAPDDCVQVVAVDLLTPAMMPAGYTGERNRHALHGAGHSVRA